MFIEYNIIIPGIICGNPLIKKPLRMVSNHRRGDFIHFKTRQKSFKSGFEIIMTLAKSVIFDTSFASVDEAGFIS